MKLQQTNGNENRRPRWKPQSFNNADDLNTVQMAASSHLCLSWTSLLVIEEPYRVNCHCFNTPAVAHCASVGSSTGAERKKQHDYHTRDLLKRHSHKYLSLVSVCEPCVLLWSDILRVYWPSALSPQQRTVEKVQSW